MEPLIDIFVGKFIDKNFVIDYSNAIDKLISIFIDAVIDVFIRSLIC